eukprot:gb/GECG01006393.1/.p1 GENE.gb/GECG01006393.1/~~gb/GECG01006393.1/.p1  ORF type:complete len:147 (+),score=3.12 gb/GECG01006393.1/:1-441(+)
MKFESLEHFNANLKLPTFLSTPYGSCSLGCFFLKNPMISFLTFSSAQLPVTNSIIPERVLQICGLELERTIICTSTPSTNPVASTRYGVSCLVNSMEIVHVPEMILALAGFFPLPWLHHYLHAFWMNYLPNLPLPRVYAQDRFSEH